MRLDQSVIGCTMSADSLCGCLMKLTNMCSKCQCSYASACRKLYPPFPGGGDNIGNVTDQLVSFSPTQYVLRSCEMTESLG